LFINPCVYFSFVIDDSHYLMNLQHKQLKVPAANGDTGSSGDTSDVNVDDMQTNGVSSASGDDNIRIRTPFNKSLWNVQEQGQSSSKKPIKSGSPLNSVQCAPNASLQWTSDLTSAMNKKEKQLPFCCIDWCYNIFMPKTIVWFYYYDILHQNQMVTVLQRTIDAMGEQ